MREDSVKRRRLVEEDIVPLTKEALEQGKTKQQAFEELAPRFYSREHLAQLISTVPHVELRRTYARANQVLVVMMVLACAVHFLLLLTTVLANGFSAFALVNSTGPLLLVFLTRRIYAMSGGVYEAVGGLALVSVLGADGLVRFSPLWSFANIALFTMTAILAFYLGEHLFPNRGWAGPRKDEDGNYLL
jgi:hypothetical protein